MASSSRSRSANKSATSLQDLLPPLPTGEHGSYLTAVNEKLGDIKQQVYNSVRDNMDVFLETLDHTTQLSQQVDRVSHELTNVKSRVKDPQNSLFSVLIDSAKTRRRLLEQERHTSVMIKVLEALVERRAQLKQLEESIQQGQVGKAFVLHQKISQALATLPGIFPDGKEPAIYTLLKAESSRLDKDLVSILDKGIAASLKLNQPESVPLLSVLTSPFQQPIFSDSPGYQESHVVNNLSLAACLAYLQALELAEPRIHSLVATLYPFIDSFLVEPSASSPVLTLSESRSGDVVSLSIVHEKRSKEPLQTIIAGLSSTITFLQFLSEHIIHALQQELDALDTSPKIASNSENRSNRASAISSKLGELLLPYLIDRLIRCCFESSIPQDSAQLDDYRNRVNFEVDRFVPLLSQFPWIQLEGGETIPNLVESLSEDSINIGAQRNGGWTSINKLVTYLKDTNLHFALKKKRTTLTRVRELLLSGSYTSRSVGEIELSAALGEIAPASRQSADVSRQSAESSPLPSTIFKFPECRVREVVLELVALCEILLKDAFSEFNASASKDQSHIQAILIETARDVLDLYRSIVPSMEQNKILNIPSLAMLFHNDCNYIAHHITLFSARYRFQMTLIQERWLQQQQPLLTQPPATPRLDSSSTLATSSHTTASSHHPSHPPSSLRTATASLSLLPDSAKYGFLVPLSFSDLIAPFRALAERFYDGIIASVVDQLQTLLKHTNDLNNTHVGANEKSCLKSLGRIVTDLENMDVTWRDILPKELHKVTMGYLVNYVVEWMVKTAQQHTDFQEAETESLNRIFNALFPLARLFLDVVDTSSSSINRDIKLACAKYVRAWLKFEDLTDIFKLSMVDIVSRFNDRSLHFSRAEVVALIVALFSDSAKRKAQIASLCED